MKYIEFNGQRLSRIQFKFLAPLFFFFNFLLVSFFMSINCDALWNEQATSVACKAHKISTRTLSTLRFTRKQVYTSMVTLFDHPLYAPEMIVIHLSGLKPIHRMCKLASLLWFHFRINHQNPSVFSIRQPYLFVTSNQLI